MISDILLNIDNLISNKAQGRKAKIYFGVLTEQKIYVLLYFLIHLA